MTKRSPYQRYQKRPHVYSPAFKAWNDAAKAGIEGDEIRALADRHNEHCARLHGPMPERQGYRASVGFEL